MFLNVDFLAGCVCGSLIIPTLVRRISAGRGGAWSVLHQRVHAAALSYIREQAVLRGEDIRATCMEATLMLMLQSAGAGVACGARREWFVKEAGLAFDETVRLKELAKANGVKT